MGRPRKAPKPLEPNDEVRVKATEVRKAFNGKVTTVTEGLIEVRSDHNGGVYLVHRSLVRPRR